MSGDLESRIRAWSAHRQGLDGSLAGASPAGVLEAAGWARTVGGVNPYLTFAARNGASRAVIEAAVVAEEIHELPSARGCTYLLPKAHYALGLAVGWSFGVEKGEIAVARKHLGVTEAELEGLCEDVLRALESGPQDPAQLRATLGDRVRSFGDAGKKRGITTSLPLALGLLQVRGEIRRIPATGRLDSERYLYAPWPTNPLRGVGFGDQAFIELARLYFRWAAPATMKHFQWFSGLGVAAAKEAIAPLGLVPIELGDNRLLFPDDFEALHSFTVPTGSQYRLVSGMDAIVLLRRDHLALLPDEDRHFAVILDERVAEMTGLSDLPYNAILDRGRIVGFWEYDPEQATIVWATFRPEASELENEVRRTKAFIRDELGDARSNSLDSPKARAPRLAALRAMAQNPA
ncbi:MAG: DNA glycosylase AlkZ-like family protein [Dehalococcoidia bacterium]